MPDFCGCVQKECKRKDKCCRFLMVFETYQSVTRPEDPDNCDLFWDVDKGAPFKLNKPSAPDGDTKGGKK